MKIERLENTSKEEIVELKSEISSQLYQARKDVKHGRNTSPYFDWDDSIPGFLAQLRLNLQNQNINPNDNAAGPSTGRDNAIGHLRGCMRGRTLKWFDDKITTKQNWELTNLLDNTGQANLVAVNGRIAVRIGANIWADLFTFN
ncbi:hypothetical protein GLOIN_2v1778046 [Rhizophagus irregularis DAOM 181602=DAOM 197198]|nr:hypothetical protein GLOIN_2v1778046 [Rhizophagus irregularis DAOM 181602=DAOM 197198]